MATQTLQETCHGCSAPHSKRISSYREDQHQRELQQKLPPTRTKPRERERRARAHTATQESEKTTDSEHIGPPECQSSLSRRQFRAKQFFFRHYFGRMGTYSNKQTSGKKWLTYLHPERERYTHAGTQQDRRMRRRPIQSIFHHQNVSLRCRDDSSGWNSFRQIRIYSKTSGKQWLIYIHRNI